MANYNRDNKTAAAHKAPPRRVQTSKRPQKKRQKKRGLKILLSALIAAVLLLCVVLAVCSIPKKAPPVNVTVAYRDIIEKYAAENGLEPEYVAAVIMAESSYDPNAVSSANALGLMQIMPETGDWIAGKFDETCTEEALFDPETNVRYGCWYLGWLMRTFGNDMTCASSAYHQGQGTVGKWLKDPEISADGVTLTNIPSDVTRAYVERILKYYERYKELYAQS